MPRKVQTPQHSTYRDLTLTPETTEGAEALLMLGSGSSPSTKSSSANGAQGSTTNTTTTPRPSTGIEVTPRGQSIPYRTPSKPNAKRKLDLEPKKTRVDSSLSALTKRFVTLIPQGGGALDLNSAARSLAVQKRRIYDITNVLEGIGVLTKKSKNQIQWSDKLSCSSGGGGGGGGVASPAELKKKKLEKELDVLNRKETEIDEWLSRLEVSMSGVSDDKRWAYVTHSDIRSISHYKDSTLLLVKAPPNTQLTVPPPTEGLQMHMKSEGGEIGVFLCPESDSNNSNQNNNPRGHLGSSNPYPTTTTAASLGGRMLEDVGSAGVLSSKLSFSSGNQQKPTTTSTSVGVGGLRLDPDVIIGMLESSGGGGGGVGPLLSPLNLSPPTTGFLELENDEDIGSYNFTLGDDEGIASLFDY